MSRAIIFLNGNNADLSHVKKYMDKQTLLIGCDGGAARILNLGLKPHVVVGDFDSFNKKLLKGIEIVELPTDKDYTDSEAAIRHVYDKGIQEIIIVGLLGDRLDHLLGNVFMLDKSDFSGADIKIVEGSQEAYLISGTSTIKGQKGDFISFIPIFSDVRAKSSVGLKYDLADYTLSMQGNTGISNEFAQDTASVSIGSQKLLVIHTIS